MNTRAIVKSTRAPFLVLSPVCVFLGASTVLANKASLDTGLFIATLLGAILAHLSVNMLNEYQDFRSGLDYRTVRTPFSGGSGALPQHPEMATPVLVLGILSLTGTAIIGLYFTWLHGLDIVPLGLAGLILIVTYDRINKHPLLCLISPGFGFGTLMIVGTAFVLQGQYSQIALIISLVPFFLTNNLLLLNQFPDIQADIEAGRRHFPIAYGTRTASFVYALFALSPAILILTMVLLGKLPGISLAALLPLPLAGYAFSGALKYGESIGSYPQYLAANVVVTLLVPLILGISVIAAQDSLPVG